MNQCYHTTKIKYLSSILRDGLQPISGNNSYIIADSRTNKISYSVGMQGAARMFDGFNRTYYSVKEGAINEDRFKSTLSPQEYAKHQQSVESITNTASFRDWIEDNIYLCFDGECILDRNEESLADAYTTHPIPAEHLKVCIIKDNRDDTIHSYSMADIYSCFFAKNPNLKRGLCTYRFNRDIHRLKSDRYSLETISLEKFCEMFPELLEEKESSENGLSFEKIGKETSKFFGSNLPDAINAIRTLDMGIREKQEIKEDQTQGDK